MPTFPGEFAGEIMHSSAYKSGPELAGKRVLIVGAGNSGCDIAVDAVHHAAAVDMSVRRGYYFVPRYIFGRPADTIGRSGPVLPRPVKQFLDQWVLRMFTGNPERFGFPRPDYKIYESHPIVNTAVLGHLGQGDLAIRPGIERFEGHTVHFDDGTRGEYDLVLLATGYVPHYPFIDPAHLDWSGAAPKLFLNIFPRNLNGIAVVGLVEATGLGWQGRYEQARLVAAYLKARAVAPERAERFRRRVREEAWPDLTGGYRYLALERMSYYVHRETYLAALAAELRGLRAPLDAGPAPGTPGAGVRR